MTPIAATSTTASSSPPTMIAIDLRGSSTGNRLSLWERPAVGRVRERRRLEHGHDLADHRLARLEAQRLVATEPIGQHLRETAAQDAILDGEPAEPQRLEDRINRGRRR